MEVSRQLLTQVQMDNIRHNQIGGETDGITPEVAQDLGFMATDQAIELVQSYEPASAPKALTSDQKNANARRHVAQHLKRVNKQVIDPHYG